MSSAQVGLVSVAARKRGSEFAGRSMRRVALAILDERKRGTGWSTARCVKRATEFRWSCAERDAFGDARHAEQWALENGSQRQGAEWAMKFREDGAERAVVGDARQAAQWVLENGGRRQRAWWAMEFRRDSA